MKNQVIFIFFFAGIIGVSVQSCCPSFLNGCCTVDCPKNEKLPDLINNLFPFEPGNEIQFTSNQFDTISFVCIDREIFNELESSGSNMVDECCDAKKVEGLKTRFEPNHGSGFSLLNYNASVAVIHCTVYVNGDTLAGRWYIDHPNPKLDIKLAGRNFTNAEVGNPDSTIFLKRDSLVGIAGFKLNGKEWRKL